MVRRVDGDVHLHVALVRRIRTEPRPDEVASKHKRARAVVVDGDDVKQISKQISWNDLVKFELNLNK